MFGQETTTSPYKEKKIEGMNCLNVHMVYHGHVKLENGLHGYLCHDDEEH